MKAEFKIKSERCKGCGICVAFCPKKVLAIDALSKVYVADIEKCIACGQCELRCPDYAIFVDKVKDDAAKDSVAKNSAVKESAADKAVEK